MDSINKKNAFFEDLYARGAAWEQEKDERQARKEELLKTHSYDSPEFKAWYKENAEAQPPYTPGECKAYLAWKRSIRLHEDEVELNDFLWEKEVHDFIDALRKAGIETFVYTNQSTAVMRNLHEFAEEGCTMLELCTVTNWEERYGEKLAATEIQGIRFKVN